LWKEGNKTAILGSPFFGGILLSYLPYYATPRCHQTDKPVSRKDAKCAKLAKKSQELPFALLCAFAPWRELF
jgi:hypothetical protein